MTQSNPLLRRRAAIRSRTTAETVLLRGLRPRARSSSGSLALARPTGLGVSSLPEVLA
jgi:hypothetical protein